MEVIINEYARSKSRSFRVKVERLGSVKDLKVAIYKYNSIKPDGQTLLYRGVVLKDHLALQHYRIRSGTTVSCKVMGVMFLQRLLLKSSTPPQDQKDQLRRSHEKGKRSILSSVWDSCPKAIDQANSGVTYPASLDTGESNSRAEDPRPRTFRDERNYSGSKHPAITPNRPRPFMDAREPMRSRRRSRYPPISILNDQQRLRRGNYKVMSHGPSFPHQKSIDFAVKTHGLGSLLPNPPFVDSSSKGKFPERAERLGPKRPEILPEIRNDISTPGNASTANTEQDLITNCPPTLPYLLSREETQERRRYWMEEAERDKFNADIHIVDPAAHYSHLHYLERYVVTNSEYFRCRGRYGIEDRTSQDRVIDSGSSPARIEVSVLKSYSILRSVLASFNYLREEQLCGTFFSMLIRTETQGVAQLVKITYRDITSLEDSFQNLIGSLGASQNFTSELTRLEDTCHLFVSRMGLDLRTRAPLAVYRMTALILDLGLVSYVGSHGSQFGWYIGSESERIEIWCEETRANAVTCSLMPLACLSGFLQTPVWVFTSDSLGSGDSPEVISVLTRMDGFADIWGPTWVVLADQNSDRILQYNLSRGYIRPTPNQSQGLGSVVLCHWYSDSDPTMQPTSRIASSSLPLSPNDMLLIGVSLIEASLCPYKLSHYEADFLESGCMGELGTIPDTWRLEALTFGVTAGQFAGFAANGTQRMLPGVTLKEHIANQISRNPRMANINWLNNFLAVEISHCTGNARRVKMRDLFRLKRVRGHLRNLMPDWETTPWGKQFSTALDDQDFGALRRVWRVVQMREDIGILVAGMLESLHTTGGQGNNVIAAYFRNRQMDKFTDIRIRGNEWADCLRDTTHIATYAVVGDMCFKYSTRRSRGICSQDCIRTKTVLQTGIKFCGDLPAVRDYVEIEPVGKLYHVNRSEMDNLAGTLTLTLSRTRRIVWRPIVGREVLEHHSSSRKQVLAFIEASEPSYGGMGKIRRVLGERSENRRDVRRLQQTLPQQRSLGQDVIRRERIVIEKRQSSPSRSRFSGCCCIQ